MEALDARRAVVATALAENETKLASVLADLDFLRSTRDLLKQRNEELAAEKERLRTCHEIMEYVRRMRHRAKTDYKAVLEAMKTRKLWRNPETNESGRMHVGGGGDVPPPGTEDDCVYLSAKTIIEFLSEDDDLTELERRDHVIRDFTEFLGEEE